MQPLQDSRTATAQAQTSLPPNRLDRPGRTTAIHGVSALVYGALFVIAGLAAAWFAFKLHSSATANDVSGLRFSFLVLSAGIGLLCGLFFSAHGVRDLIGAARTRRFSAEEPTKPWLGDYAWRPEGFKFSALRETSKLLTTAMIGTAIVAPFIWVAIGNPLAWAFDLFVAMLAVFPGYAWWRWLVMLLETLRFGGSFLKYETFPFFVGSPLKARLRLHRNGASIQSLTLTLRCVQEKYVTIGGRSRWGGGRRTTFTESYELFKSVLVLDQPQMAPLNGDGIPVQLSIPEGLPSTQLSSKPPIYWEIEATGATQGPPYKSVFLVPVYSALRT